MAAPTAGTSASSSGLNVSSLTFAHTVNAGSDLALVVTTATGDATLSHRQIASVTWNGVSLTQLSGAVADDGTWVSSDIWYLLNPTPATGNVVITPVTGTTVILAGGATNWSGVHQTVPWGTPAHATGSGATASVAVSSAAGETVVGAISSDSESGITPTGTQLWEIEDIGSDVSAGAQYYSGAGSVTVQWGQAATGWAVSGAALKPVASSRSWFLGAH